MAPATEVRLDLATRLLELGLALPPRKVLDGEKY